MGRKLFFKLEMENGKMVDNMEELRESFSIPRIKYYMENGSKLDTWLRDRGEDEIADALNSIETKNEDFALVVCGIFSVNYEKITQISKTTDMDSNQIRRVEILKKYTDNFDYMGEIDCVAFNQEELEILANKSGVDKIYLCGDSFSISINRMNKKYIGINCPIVKLEENEELDIDEQNIKFENVRLDEKYKKRIAEKKDKKKIEENVKMKRTIYKQLNMTFLGNYSETLYGLETCLQVGYYEIDTTGERLYLTDDDRYLAKCVIEDLKNAGIVIREERLYLENWGWEPPKFTFANYINANVIPRLLSWEDNYIYGCEGYTFETPFTQQYLDFMDNNGDGEMVDIFAGDLGRDDEVMRYLLEYNGDTYYYSPDRCYFIRKTGEREEIIFPGGNSLVGRIIACKNRIWFVRVRDDKLCMYNCETQQMVEIKDKVCDISFFENKLYCLQMVDFSRFSKKYVITCCTLDGRHGITVKNFGWVEKDICDIYVKNMTITYNENQYSGHVASNDRWIRKTVEFDDLFHD